MQAHNRRRSVSHPQRTAGEKQKAEDAQPRRRQSVIKPDGCIEIAKSQQRSRNERHRKYCKPDTQVEKRRVGLPRPKINNRFVKGRVSREENQLNDSYEERQTAAHSANSRSQFIVHPIHGRGLVRNCKRRPLQNLPVALSLF
jgi:hypothetical protein